MISQEALAERAGITRSSVAVHISNLMKKGYIAGKGYVLRLRHLCRRRRRRERRYRRPVLCAARRADSNPGRVRISLGGVGRNIAHNMSLLGVDVRLLTAFGDDLHAQRVAASCGELGIDISHALQVPGGTTSTYLFLNDVDGDMALGLSDMDICERITPAYLASNLSLLNNAQVIGRRYEHSGRVPAVPCHALYPPCVRRSCLHGEGAQGSARARQGPHA